MANFEKLLSENLKSLNERIGRYGGISSHPYENYQIVHRYPTQLTVTSSPLNPFGLTQGGVIDHTLMNSPIPSNSEIGAKFSSTGGTGTGYAHSGLESQSYGAPQWPSSSKEGKLKGAALSALTFLAFLFFLNLLQTCMKEHIDTMHPGVSYSTLSR